MKTTSPGVALVTGASSGIGLATANALRNAGFRVFGTSRRAAVLAAFADRPGDRSMMINGATWIVAARNPAS
ncbi:MAG: SDR family NAD(P)-dependent oxidoreductase [Mesorhizobium sp.]|uniref:SDR family NAD(P)-dependent oxidoreductase n=1 Tax=unclassified Mesorhizobium TaxID=325217 RepID=UPI000FCA1465|nr:MULTISPECIES: SDR family NAD(P)-dependent oxidoreductase [unclassified Mesorhizobium]RUW41356.1 SDR family NAD(P)-dependent oxidoreductase [Mesorhizobium sp. M2A.F.Ca.ET.015.02.1.1]RVC97100.1 SDR family NAD(P)-dependent oxidoreductase [Mesorhizobium sp. M2A.F.Ca.ET.017.03.2.1]RVC99048.1 SDR family NAD(P)-dependent oxidoreductase [Mesorhizobium sp. M2A.F.Ca.ET.029.05.1.1]RWB37957.1 MAG: SDR family NAD(P)-dependent oxidoreductase [Mesorhizobium sp.]RWB55281.1 MAG: SDR family NAD(P)-dependent 